MLCEVWEKKTEKEANEGGMEGGKGTKKRVSK